MKTTSWCDAIGAPRAPAHVRARAVEIDDGGRSGLAALHRPRPLHHRATRVVAEALRAAAVGRTRTRRVRGRAWPSTIARFLSAPRRQSTTPLTALLPPRPHRHLDGIPRASRRRLDVLAFHSRRHGRRPSEPCVARSSASPSCTAPLAPSHAVTASCRRQCRARPPPKPRLRRAHRAPASALKYPPRRPATPHAHPLPKPTPLTLSCTARRAATSSSPLLP